MNERQPPIGEKMSLADLKGEIDQNELKARQRLEMLREGHKVDYGGLILAYEGEREATQSVIVLRDPETKSIVEVPLTELADERWRLSDQ